MTTITTTVLTADATMIGGIKKNPRFLTRKFAIPSTHLRRIHLSCRHAVSSSIPMMLDGSLMPVSHTISSPIARKPKMIPH